MEHQIGIALLLTAGAGLSTTIGSFLGLAVLAALVLLPFLTEAVLGWILAVVAGIMVSLAIDELVPAAKSFGSDHTSFSVSLVERAACSFRTLTEVQEQAGSMFYLVDFVHN